MADGTKIEWSDATWNIINGCSVISPGCKHCYAMRLAGTRLKHVPSRAGLTTMTKAGPVWNGEVYFDEKVLMQPLRWRRPRKIFVCAHGDLFHENVPDEWIDKVFAVMALASHHTYQVLTKRPDRMREYLNSIENGDERIRGDGWRDALIEGSAQSIWHERTGDNTVAEWLAVHLPLKNVWIGTSIEDRTRLEERAPILADIDWPTKFWSAEPLLGDLGLIPREWIPDWVIVGGESGPGWREMRELWAEKLLAQVKNAGKAGFMKQMAGKAPIPQYLMIREMPNA